jgi:GNAT superfamily N-acetyltransferase
VIIVRAARPADAPAMSGVLIASITELCVADHQNVPKVVAGWTANKTPEGVLALMNNMRHQAFVAELDGEIAAVGLISADGTIGLNYVAPQFRFQGVSRKLLAHMEDALCRTGTEVASLLSTQTALVFYQEAGWVDAGPPQRGFTLVGYPMRKVLQVPVD